MTQQRLHLSLVASGRPRTPLYYRVSCPFNFLGQVRERIVLRVVDALARKRRRSQPAAATAPSGSASHAAATAWPAPRPQRTAARQAGPRAPAGGAERVDRRTHAAGRRLYRHTDSGLCGEGALVSRHRSARVEVGGGGGGWLLLLQHTRRSIDLCERQRRIAEDVRVRKKPLREGRGANTADGFEILADDIERMRALFGQFKNFLPAVHLPFRNESFLDQIAVSIFE